jgi:tetratricopeptide (TPR) repeat protein
MVMEKAIRFEERLEAKRVETQDTAEEEDDDVEEMYTSVSRSEIETIVADCKSNKSRGNKTFAAGEYAQSILLYSLALDKAHELLDKDAKKQLFCRHIVLANRSAAFLKMGEHEKALADATRAQEIDPMYVKGVFRRGLALHAMGQYQEAIKVLAEANRLEPKNKQIKQALQFAEIRMTQELRKRME